MSREREIAHLLIQDSVLTNLLTGGIHVYADTDQDGITRATTGAFGADGFLLPCCLCKQRGQIPDGWVDSGEAQIDSAFQIVELYFYQDRGYTTIDQAVIESRRILRGNILPNSFDLEIANVLDRQHDYGALKGASLIRVDWAVYAIQRV